MNPALLEPREINPEIKGICDGLHVDPEDAPNFLHMLALSLTAMRAYAGAENALAKGQLIPKQREQIALAIAEINGSKYCTTAHTVAGKKAGLSDEDIRLARRSEAVDPKTNSVLEFAQAVVLQRGEIKIDNLKDARRAGISESELVEIIANVAINVFTNYLNLLSKAELDLPSPRWSVPAARGAGLQ